VFLLNDLLAKIQFSKQMALTPCFVKTIKRSLSIGNYYMPMLALSRVVCGLFQDFISAREMTDASHPEQHDFLRRMVRHLHRELVEQHVEGR
jgi:hypothetical protein